MPLSFQFILEMASTSLRFLLRSASGMARWCLHSRLQGLWKANILNSRSLMADSFSPILTGFTSRPPNTAKHQNVQQLSANFFRFTLAAPIETTSRIAVANANRAWTTLHFQTTQNGKPCAAGHIMLTNLTAKGHISGPTGCWRELPPKHVAIETLEANNDPSWTRYLTPFQPDNFPNAHSYTKFHIRFDQPPSSFMDKWVSPGLQQDGKTSVNACWSDEHVHFICDSLIPSLQDIFYPNGYQKLGTTLWSNTIATDLRQRHL